MNTYQVQIYPEGWSPTSPIAPFTVQAHQFTTTDDYIVFIDDANPPNGLMMVPFSVNPVVTRTATSAL